MVTFGGVCSDDDGRGGAGKGGTESLKVSLADVDDESLDESSGRSASPASVQVVRVKKDGLVDHSNNGQLFFENDDQ